MTDNTQLATIDQAEFQAFIEANRVSQEDLNGGSDYLPQLKVNYLDEDENKKELKPGLFTITGQDVPSYAKNVKFRPLFHKYQYIDYDEAEKKVVNRSVFFDDFKEEAYDEKGGVRCGKPESKYLKDDAALKKSWAHVSLYRSVDGLVSYDGVDADGNAVKVDNVLVTFRGKGVNFSPFQEEYLKLLPKGTFLWDYELKLGTTKHKQDPKSAANYYVVHFEADFSQRLPLTSDLWETIKSLQKRVEDTNKDIHKKYFNANRSALEDAAAIDAIDITPNDAPLDEDVPF